MSEISTTDLIRVREAMARFEISPSVAPNETIGAERVFFPKSHGVVLDMKRQLVVGNRGMGKSFWTHALTNPDVLKELAHRHSYPALAGTSVVIGFNGSEKANRITPTREEIEGARNAGASPDLLWRAVILRAVKFHKDDHAPRLNESLDRLKQNPAEYAEVLTAVDDENLQTQSAVLLLFDALDRLGNDWEQIRILTGGLLRTVLGLQSFPTIRAKVFMRADQYADEELFKFPDSSKLKNNVVNLAWKPYELYGLLLFDLMRGEPARTALKNIAISRNVELAQPKDADGLSEEHQREVIAAIAGQHMGKDPKRGRVYTWVPLHLSDVAGSCSPRTFLTAWQVAAKHGSVPAHQAVDHLGLIEGVRSASTARLTELREDYSWIDSVLAPLRGQHVPIERQELLKIWKENGVDQKVQAQGLAPIHVADGDPISSLLRTLTSIAVLEERANGKINVPDIYRVEAGILRKGGVSVPRKK